MQARIVWTSLPASPPRPWVPGIAEVTEKAVWSTSLTIH